MRLYSEIEIRLSRFGARSQRDPSQSKMTDSLPPLTNPCLLCAEKLCEILIMFALNGPNSLFEKVPKYLYNLLKLVKLVKT